jgi:23S rRNA (guanosine2251-2'-O)-methyltransferase
MARATGGSGKKGPHKGTGGHGRRKLEGKGPTPKAEDRVYHAAHKRKVAAERVAA